MMKSGLRAEGEGLVKDTLTGQICPNAGLKHTLFNHKTL